MGYFVKRLPLRKSLPDWKLQFVSYKNEDIKNSKAKKPKREWDVKKGRWQALGFHGFMTLEEARVRAKQLNAQLHIKRQEVRIRELEANRSAAQKRYDSMLPEEFVAEFESRFIRKRDSQTEQGLRKNTRAYITWRAAQRLIVAINTEPSEWFYHTHKIYDYFYQQKMSLRYLQAVLRMANLWGFFICRKLAHPFLPVSSPRGYERLRLIDANYEKTNASRPSKPITPRDLERVADTLNQINFNWLLISVWFGLRPKEIDSLKDPNSWRIEEVPTGRKVLWVFQTKVVALPREDRWKPIPVLFDEQHFALKIIQDGTFKRPLRKTTLKNFGPGVTTYAGRKGFTDLMLSKGQSLENISVWMGHSTIQRTWNNYKNRRKFHLVGY